MSSECRARRVQDRITLPTARAIAETGVNALSVGALTHSAPALDLSMQLQP